LRDMVRKPMFKKTMANEGFTLIEIMMVMVLVLIVIGTSTIFFANRLPSENLNAAGREMSAMLRFARLLAKNSGEPRSVLIDLNAGRYGIPGVQTRTVPRGITVRVTDPLEGDIVQGDYSINFNESGGAALSRITLTGGRRVLHIDLDPVLGAVILRP